jgi:CRISPR-associated protein Csm5
MSNIAECKATLRLEPISPSRVFVWSGNYLIRGLEFLIDGNEILILKNDLVIDELARAGITTEEPVKLMERVRDLVRRGRDRFVRLSADLSKLGISSNVNRVMDINPYVVPASELKGLIRTAVLNYKLQHVSSQERQRVYNEVLGRLRNAHGRKSLVTVAQPVEKLLKTEVRMGTRPYEYDSLNRLRISDPIDYEKATLEFTEIQTWDRDGSIVAVNHVIAWVSNPLTYNLVIQKPPSYPNHYNNIREKDSEITCNLIKDSLRELSNYLVRTEIEKVNSFIKDARNRNRAVELQQYLNFLTYDLSHKCGDDCLCVRIGMFTGHEAKTVAVNDQVSKVREIAMSSIYHHTWDSKTLKVARIPGGFIGMGWVRLCLQ